VTGEPTYTLTPEELEAFWHRGYVGPYTAFKPGEMADACRTVVERVLTTPSRHSIVYRARHLDSRTVFSLSRSPAILGRMGSLFGPDLMLWATHLFDKPPAHPGHPEEFPWHQDWYAWRLEPMVTVSAWLALTPTMPENGCLEVIPGSHTRPVPLQRTTDLRYSIGFGGMRADPAHFREADKVALPMEAGQFILFNERLLHHSEPNRTRDRRIGLGIRVTLPFVKVHESFPCIMVGGRDSFGFNQFIEPPAQEPDESDWWTTLPFGSDVKFDRPVPGLGWYLPETDGIQSFCWSGPGQESWLDLPVVGPGERVFRCAIAHALDPQCLEKLHVRINGQPLSFRQQVDGHGVQLEGSVPSQLLAGRPNRLRVTFLVPRMVRPCDVNPASPDARPLGIAVSRVALEPE
jgi:ectoine hydroxylase-related dioxygenase (phytanoyl-CoA dioxygenase family)